MQNVYFDAIITSHTLPEQLLSHKLCVLQAAVQQCRIGLVCNAIEIYALRSWALRQYESHPCVVQVET